MTSGKVKLKRVAIVSASIRITFVTAIAYGNILLVYLYDESDSPIGLLYRESSYAEDVFDEYYFTKNLQGDIIGIYDNAGKIVVQYYYDAWGNIHRTGYYPGSEHIADANPFRYRGYYFDQETGFYYLNSRYYDPEVKRFINADTQVSGVGGDLRGYNAYAYCFNNPVMMVDPDGEFPWLIAVLVVVTVVMVAATLSSCSKSEETVGAAPNYVEIGASNGTREENPNCYSYAIGEYGASYNPGDFSGNSFDISNVHSVANSVISDMETLGRSARIIDNYNSAISDNEYRIALRVGYYNEYICDYHFMVQTSSGKWAEKHGPGGSTVLHNKGNPNTISWDLPGFMNGFYNSEIVYLAVSK